MDLDFIARLLDLVERSEIAELDLTLNGARLRLVKSHVAAVQEQRSAGPNLEVVPPPAVPAFKAPSAPTVTPAAGPHAIRAGFPGTFYRAPAPGEKAFVSDGDDVEEGRQLAILEAMKTMNPVEADIGGRIARIAVEDGQAVETGDLLFEIASAAP